ncbi:MAG: flagellar biosynthesis protein FlhB [Calditrichia bacterium]
MADSFQEKTEQPTPKRLEEARNKGNVAKSMEVNSAFSLIFGLFILYVMSGMFFRQFTQLFRSVLSGGYMAELTPTNIQYYFLQGLEKFGLVVALFMGTLMIIGVASSILQVGFMFTLEPLMPKGDKLNPLKGLKKIIFSKRSLEELIKNILKLTVIILVAYHAVMGYRSEFIPLMDKDVAQVLTFMLSAALKIGFKIALIFLAVGAADYAFQKWEHTNNLKMTKQEVKDEMKQAEGDPKVKARIRSMQYQMARNRMMQSVPEADVVITNPTHYAIALTYKLGNQSAPTVVAKGRNLIAYKIKEIARENDVPIVEDPPLARALYKSVEIDQEIPAKFFQAVAEILAYVYKLKNKKLD